MFDEQDPKSSVLALGVRTAAALQPCMGGAIPAYVLARAATLHVAQRCARLRTPHAAQACEMLAVCALVCALQFAREPFTCGVSVGLPIHKRARAVFPSCVSITIVQPQRARVISWCLCVTAHPATCASWFF